MPHVHEKGRGHGSKTAGVPLTSSLPFSLDSAVQALCSAFISCLCTNEHVSKSGAESMALFGFVVW